MKLTIEHLAPYLPYGLEVVFDGKINGILAGVGLSDLLFDLTIIEKNNKGKAVYKKWCLTDTMPILRPLSDLIKNINIGDGQTLTPLYYLNCMRGVAVNIKDYDLFEDDGDCLICKWSGVYSFYFERQTTSFYDNSTSGLSPQFAMFQKLFEWHFDIFELIEKGLAIDINTAHP